MSHHAVVLDERRDPLPGSRLLYVTAARYEGDWHCTPHTHHFTEIFFIRKGSGTFFVEGAVYPVRENDLILLNPHVLHTERAVEGSPFDYVAAGVEGLAFTFSGGDGPEGMRIFRYPDKHTEWRFCMDALMREAEQAAPFHGEVCRDLLEVLFIGLIRRSQNTLAVDRRQSRLGRADRAAVSARKYIDAHYREPLALDDLAAIAHVSKYYLVHTFTESYGLSPMQYLTARRVEECKKLLATTDYSAAQIAAFTGFSSQSYLSQAFRRLTGQTPGAYRRSVGSK